MTDDIPALIEHIKNGIDYRLNAALCEMKEGYDDSVVGFNEAWDIVRAYFKERTEALSRTVSPLPEEIAGLRIRLLNPAYECMLGVARLDERRTREDMDAAAAALERLAGEKEALRAELHARICELEAERDNIIEAVASSAKLADAYYKRAEKAEAERDTFRQMSLALETERNRLLVRVRELRDSANAKTAHAPPSKPP